MVYKKRHLAKAITYRLLGTLVTFALVLGCTGNLPLATAIAPVELLLKTAGYYFHERMWYHIKWGRRIKT